VDVAGNLRLGVVGLSDGNGHPYSWSAIFNGYDPAAMEACGYPVIPRYLERQSWPEAAIPGARVTHVWTQSPELSRNIAKAARIAIIADRLEDMLDAVDGILLARDDAETHFEMARPFLEAGLPVYIDKPVALSLADLDRLYALERYPGQIFTCSALAYASELKLSAADAASIGRLRHIVGSVPKDWERYAVHVIEPLVKLLNEQGEIVATQAWRHGEMASLNVAWEGGAQATVTTFGSAPAPLSLRVCGERGWKDLFFTDTFAAFKAALEDFVAGIRARDVRSDRRIVRRVVDLIERGRA